MKENKFVTMLTRSILAVAMAVLVLAGAKTDAKAATAPQGTYTLSNQTYSSTGSIKVNCNYSALDRVSSVVYISVDQVTWTETTGSVYAGVLSVSGLPNAGATYYVKARPYTGYGTGALYGADSNVVEVVTNPNAKPETINFSSSSVDSINLSWTEVAGASGYSVTYYDENTSRESAVTVNAATNSLVLTGLNAGAEYNVSVTPYKTSASGYTAMGDSYNWAYGIPTVPTKPTATISSFYPVSHTLYVDSSRVDSGASYEAKVCDLQGNELITTTSSYYGLSFNNEILAKYKVYQVYVRAVSYDSAKNAQYSEWSDPVLASRQVSVNGKKSKGALKLSWKKVAGAKRYVVYATNSKTGTYKKVATVTKNTASIKKIGKKSLKKGKTYYYYVLPQIKQNGSWVSVQEGSAPYCNSTKF